VKSIKIGNLQKIMQNSLRFGYNKFLSFAFIYKQSRNIRLFSVRKPKSFQLSHFFSSKMANTEFSFNSYDLIGFDLDNCLVRYNVKNMIHLEYNCLSEFLIKRGYSKEFLLKPIDEDWLQKGLILDFEKGNLLRVCPGKLSR
jgi:hypothetical protein